MASELYAAQVRLLMRVLPFLGLQTDLALKGLRQGSCACSQKG